MKSRRTMTRLAFNKQWGWRNAPVLPAPFFEVSVMSDLINADTARKFLELIHARAANALSHLRRPGLLQLVSIAPDDKGMTISPFVIGDVGAMLEAAIADARSKRNVYCEIRSVRAGRPNERP